MSQRPCPRTLWGEAHSADTSSCPLEAAVQGAAAAYFSIPTADMDSPSMELHCKRFRSKRCRMRRDRLMGFLPWLLVAFLVVVCLRYAMEDEYSPCVSKIREGLQFLRWGGLSKHKAAMQRYGTVRNPLELQHMPAWIVSLRLSKERREKVVREMAGQSLKYSFVDAIDGMHDPIPTEELQLFLSARRVYEGGSPFQRRKIATDVTNMRLLYRMLAENVHIAMIMEDDFVLPQGDLLQRLNATMAELPADWDLFALNACSMRKHGQRLGAFVGEGIRILKTGSCTLCVVVHRRAAMKVLEAAKRQLVYTNWDNLLVGYMAQTGSLNSYVADPPLCLFDEHGKSIIEPNRAPFSDVLS